jgi:hypothetical protein
MQAPMSGRRGTLSWRFAFLALLLLLCFVGCNKTPTTEGGPAPEEGTSGGALDVVNADGIAGWAWDSSQPDTPIKVDIYDGDKKLATIVADQFRPDLLDDKRTMGDGKHAFNYATPDSLKDGKSHTIRAKVAGTDTELYGSPKVFKSP